MIIIGQVCKYVYDKDNNKFYLDGNTFFRLDDNQIRVNLSDSTTQIYYKKALVLNDATSYTTYYQALNRRL